MRISQQLSCALVQHNTSVHDITAAADHNNLGWTFWFTLLGTVATNTPAHHMPSHSGVAGKSVQLYAA